MEQAAAAARALAQTNDVALARALETAMVVCFLRPYAGELSVPRSFRPPTNDGSTDARVFREMMRLRNQVYAHKDEQEGHSSGPIAIDEESEIVDLNWREGWEAFSRELLPDVIVLAEKLRDEMRVSAAKIQAMLDADIPVERR
jgi:hypothetical protein